MNSRDACGYQGIYGALMVTCILVKLQPGDDPAIQGNPPYRSWVVGISSPLGALLHVIDTEAMAPDFLPIPHTSEALN